MSENILESQFGLLPRLLWPLAMHEVSVSRANPLERLVDSCVRKCLGLPKGLSSVGLYSDCVTTNS